MHDVHSRLSYSFSRILRFLEVLRILVDMVLDHTDIHVFVFVGSLNSQLL